MAQQSDLGKGVLISGIIAGVLAIAASFVLLPEVPQGKKYNVGAGDVTDIADGAAKSTKINSEIGSD